MHNCFWVCLLTHFIQSLRLLPFGFLSLFCMSVCLLFVLAMENFTDLIHIVSANQKIGDHRKWCLKGSEDMLLRWAKGDLNLCKQFRNSIFLTCSENSVLRRFSSWHIPLLFQSFPIFITRSAFLIFSLALLQDHLVSCS